MVLKTVKRLSSYLSSFGRWCARTPASTGSGGRPQTSAVPPEPALGAPPLHRVRRADVVADPLPVAVDGAVDDRAVDRRVAGGVVVAGALGAAQGRGDGCAQGTDNRHDGILHGPAVSGRRG